MSIVALKVENPERDFGRYSLCAERMIEQAQMFEEIAESDDRDREELGIGIRTEYANWLEGRAAGYRHAAKVIRRTVDMFAHEEISL